MRERTIEAWLRKKIETQGGVFLKFTSPGRDGVPDRIAIFPDASFTFASCSSVRPVVQRTRGRFLSTQ